MLRSALLDYMEVQFLTFLETTAIAGIVAITIHPLTNNG